MNHAICANMRFEGIASEIEPAGHEVVICLDLSANAEVRGSYHPIRNLRSSGNSNQLLNGMLSGSGSEIPQSYGNQGRRELTGKGSIPS